MKLIRSFQSLPRAPLAMARTMMIAVLIANLFAPSLVHSLATALLPVMVAEPLVGLLNSVVPPAGVAHAQGAVQVTKTLNTTGAITAGSPVSFTITIQNSGGAAITTLPLIDDYDVNYLSFDTVADGQSSTPATDPFDDGSILWSDVTDFSSGGQLDPNESVSLTVYFTALASTANLAAGPQCAPAGETENLATAGGTTDCAALAIAPQEAKFTLGDRIWHDIDNDGNQDANEPGINGVVVNLYEITGSGPTFIISATTVTTGTVTGFYQFETISGHAYQVEIDASNFAPGGPLAGFTVAANQPDITGTTVATRTLADAQTNIDTFDFGYYCRFDLALDKRLAVGQSSTIAPGEDVAFTITIYNQGAVSATGITIADYIPAGFTLSTNDTNGWTGGPSGTVTAVTPGNLAPGASITRNIVLTAGAVADGTYTNAAEIATAQSLPRDLNNASFPEADSTPDSINANQLGEQAPNLEDNQINEDGTNGGDEDDHDLEPIVVSSIPQVDVSKTLNGINPFAVGQSISFTIRITNTGSSVVTTLPLTDTYDVAHISFDTVRNLSSSTPADEADDDGSIRWNDVTNFSSGGQLDPGESVTLVVYFTAQASTAALTGGIACEAAGQTYNRATAGTGQDCVSITVIPPETKFALGDYIWHDINNDGIQDPNEPGINGVLLNLYEITSNGLTFVTSTTTIMTGTLSGFYEFQAVSGRSYQIEVDASNFAPGGPLAGFVLGSNQPDITGTTVATRIVANVQNNDDTLDFGYYCRFDLALDKRRATGQPSAILPGDDVTFTLTIYNQGVVTATNITIADYVPTGFTVSAANTATWNGTSGTVTTTLPGQLAPGASVTVDMILTAGLTLSGTYTNTAEIASAESLPKDLDGNSFPEADSTPDAQDGNSPGEQAPNREDNQINEDGTQPGQDEDDHDLAPIIVNPFTYSVGNQVFADVNNNALRDPGEPGIPGVTVLLYDPNGTPNDFTDDIIVDSMTTITDGLYLFTDLLAGEYYIRVADANFIGAGPLVGYVTSNDALDEDDPEGDQDNIDNGVPVGNMIISNIFFLGDLNDPEPTGENPDNDPNTPDTQENLTIDFGFFQPFSVGNQVFEDLNNNAVRDLGEPGIPGVTVILYDPNGTPNDPNDDIIIDSMNTITDGLYLFTDLPAGDYYIQVADANFTGTGPLVGYFSSNDALDEDDPEVGGDNNDNGGPVGTTIVSGIFTLGGPSFPEPTGENPDNDPTTPDTQENLTIDFGFYSIFDLALRKTLAAGQPGTVLAGDLVTFTVTISNQGSVDAYHIDIVDYIPAGLTYVSASGGGVIDNGGGNIHINALPVGTHVSFDVQMQVAVNATPGNIINWAEIEDAKRVNDVNAPTAEDIDSTPDSQNGNTPGEVNYIDDEIGQDGKNGGDEDDHDPETLIVAVPGVFDLALRKSLAPGQNTPVLPGHPINFAITVFNQGTVDAYRIRIIDYIPAGMTLTGSTATAITQTVNSNPVSIADNGGGSYTVDTLQTGDRVSFNVTLSVDGNFTGTSLRNSVEIESADDDTDPNNPPPTDIDSTPDNQTENTPGENTNQVDDEINEDGNNGGDEDDHDSEDTGVRQLTPALALSKTLNTPEPLRLSDPLSFTIRITNTGEITITRLPLRDTYNRVFIGFDSADPMPDSATDDGQLDWSDLLANDPDGLGISETLSIVVTFTAQVDTSALPAVACAAPGQVPNVAHVHNALADPDGTGLSPAVSVPNGQDCDDVAIEGPTSVRFSQRKASQTAEGVLIEWTTTSEADIIGFFVQRESSGLFAAHAQGDMISARSSGQSQGNAYSFLDADITLTADTYYVLEVVLTDGRSERLSMERVGVLANSIYLPEIQR